MQRNGLLDVIFELDQHLAGVVKHAAEKRLAEVEVDRARYARDGHQPDLQGAHVLAHGHEVFLARHLQDIRALVTDLYQKAQPPVEPE